MAEQSKKSDEQIKYDPNTDHNECIRILNLVLDGEATNGEREFFKDRLKNCMPYWEIYNVDMAIKELIKKMGYDKTCPDGLVDEIKAKIKAPTQ